MGATLAAVFSVMKIRGWCETAHFAPTLGPDFEQVALRLWDGGHGAPGRSGQLWWPYALVGAPQRLQW